VVAKNKPAIRLFQARRGSWFGNEPVPGWVIRVELAFLGPRVQADEPATAALNDVKDPRSRAVQTIAGGEKDAGFGRVAEGARVFY